MSLSAQMFLTAVGVVIGVAAAWRAKFAFEARRPVKGIALLALFAAMFVGLLWLGFRPVEEPADCVFVSPHWVDGVETTRCVPRGGR